MDDNVNQSGSDKCGKKTDNPFFNFLRCYRTRADRQHKSAMENAVQGAREWNRLNEEQRKPFVEMAKPFLKPESELKYPRQSTVGRKTRRRRRSRGRSKTKTAKRGARSTARSRSRRRVKSRAPSRRRRAATSRTRTTRRKTTTKRRGRSRSRASRPRGRAKRTTQSSVEPQVGQMNQTQAPEIEAARLSMQPSTCPRPTCHFSMPKTFSMTTPAPAIPPETPDPTNSSACDSRNRLAKDCEPCSDCGSLSQHVVVDVAQRAIDVSNDCFRNDRSCPCCIPPPTDSCGGSGTKIHVNCNCNQMDEYFRKR